MGSAFVKLKKLILLAGDLAILYLSLWLAVLVRLQLADGSRVTFEEHLAPYSVVFFLWLLIFAANGMYDLAIASTNVRFIRTLAVTLAVCALTATGVFYFVPFGNISPKTTLFLHLGLFAAMLLIWRTLYNTVFGRVLRTRVLLIGDNEEIRELIPLIRNQPSLGYDLAGIILPEDGTWIPDPQPPITRRGFSDFQKIIKEEKIGALVLGMSPRQSSDLAHRLYESIFLQVRFIDALPFYEQLTHRVPVAAVSRVWFLENLREGEKRAFDFSKRGGDLVIGGFVFVFTLLITPFVAAAILLTSGRPILFRQTRVGRLGKPFRMIKFRTMIRDAEVDGAQFAEKKDHRVTPIGRLLRATRIDELPQVWNVLAGDMSFVGPRPERPEFVKELESAMPFYSMRHLIRPGLTGWAQIQFPYANTIEQNLKKLQYDLYYIKHRNLLLEIMILLRTVGIILRAKGQ